MKARYRTPGRRVKRAYRSEARAAGAEQTRRAIVSAARRLFAADGFAATPIERIAAGAGVAVQTVYATFGNKRALLQAMLDEIEAKADLTALQQALDGPAQDQPAAFARFLSRLFSRGGDIIRAARAAGDADPELRALMRKGNARHARGAATLAAGWSRAGALRRGIDVAHASAVLAAISGYGVYADLRAAGWSNARYEAWLTDAIRRLLLTA